MKNNFLNKRKQSDYTVLNTQDNQAKKTWYCKQKGQRYERQIGKFFEESGYKVYFKGINEGKMDGGIDLIASKNKEILLIQCKNWENMQVKQEHLRIFMGDCAVYVEKNRKNLRNKTLKKVFVTSCQIQEYAAKKYASENHIEYVIIPYNRAV